MLDIQVLFSILTNTFVYLGQQYESLAIRFYLNPKDKDKAVFSLSLPHLFTAFKERVMKDTVIGIAQVDFKKENGSEFGLIISKSPACAWSDLLDPILTFLFTLMIDMYAWKVEKQAVKAELMNKTMVKFHLRLETKHHLALGRRLHSIKGIETGALEEFPICMDHDRNYDFNLSRAEMFSWGELLPEIRTVFQDYFPAGVEFEGYGKEILNAKPQTNNAEAPAQSEA